SRETLPQSERNQDAASIGRQLQAGPGFLEFFGLLEYRYADSCTRKGQRGGQTGNAFAGYDSMTRRRHGQNPDKVQAAAECVKAYCGGRAAWESSFGSMR